MDPAAGGAGSFLRFLQDPGAGPSSFTPASQPGAVLPPPPGFFMAPVPFPPFCTQPPPRPAPPPSAPAPAAPTAAGTRSGRRRRVSAVPEGGDEVGRRYYSTDEDLMLVSAWLKCSKDPIAGNARKIDTYWAAVAETYNITSPPGREREPSCLKGHWFKTTPKVTLFNAGYCQLRDEHASGRNEQQLLDEAMALYKSRSQGSSFGYKHWWAAVCDEPKWNAHVNSHAKGPKKFTPDLNMNAAPANQERPIGVKKAKRGKGVSAEMAKATVEAADHLKALVEAKESQREELEAMKLFQEKLADRRQEAANTHLKAALEMKEANKIEAKHKSMELFTQMLQMDTSTMNPFTKELHERALTVLAEQALGHVDSDEAH